mmetsp:Transcript_51400/g.145533  ORF Transcript_51400/g.145533 Transcript_51400/m.145533 type:complete len:313 (+) Transcript_51400:134-1072(+)
MPVHSPGTGRSGQSAQHDPILWRSFSLGGRLAHGHVARLDGAKLEDLFLQDGGRTLRERLVRSLELTRARLLHVTEDLSTVFGDHADVHVASGAKVVEDTGTNCLSDQSLALLVGHVLPVLRLQDRHRGQRAAAHRGEWEHVRGAVGVDLVQVRAVHINATQHQGATDVALVLEERGAEAPNHRADPGLSPRGEPQELHLRLHELRGVLEVRGGARPRAENVVRNVVQLFAILVGNHRTLCSTGISSQNNGILQLNATDGGATLHRRGILDARRLRQVGIPVAQLKTEAAPLLLEHLHVVLGFLDLSHLAAA